MDSRFGEEISSWVNVGLGGKRKQNTGLNKFVGSRCTGSQIATSLRPEPEPCCADSCLTSQSKLVFVLTILTFTYWHEGLWEANCSWLRSFRVL